LGKEKSAKRKDIFHGNAKVGSVEKTLAEKLGLPGLQLTNKSGRNTRSDKLMKNHRKDWNE
jgi:hypothetical protein